MIVCMTRRIAIHLYQTILEKRPEWKNKMKVVLTSSNKDEEEWHDIIGNKAYRDQLMATMYIDKPMKGHNLMQAIARVNRVYQDKEAGLCKCGDRMGITANEINSRIMTLLEQAIEQDGVYNIFVQAGKKNPEISILSEEYMEKIRRMKHRNIAAEMLRKLLEDNIRVFAKTGVVKSQLFSEKMQNLLKMYNNRLITSAEVIEELLNLSKEMTEAYQAGDEKGLSVEELAFYDALAADPEVLKKMQDEVLVKMAQELTELIRRSRTFDWDKKESARAYMRTQVKHLLRKYTLCDCSERACHTGMPRGYKYSPEKAKGAIDIVIKQAELMSSNIKL